MGSIGHPSMTVAEMWELGVDCIRASCAHCCRRWRVPVDFLPPATTLAKIEELIICQDCGRGGLKVSVAL